MFIQLSEKDTINNDDAKKSEPNQSPSKSIKFFENVNEQKNEDFIK